MAHTTHWNTHVHIWRRHRTHTHTKQCTHTERKCHCCTTYRIYRHMLISSVCLCACPDISHTVMNTHTHTHTFRHTAMSIHTIASYESFKNTNFISVTTYSIGLSIHHPTDQNSNDPNCVICVSYLWVQQYE